jgi:DNA-3-methyladenine glycosylase II
MADRLAEARAYLRNADPVLAALIDKHPDFDPRAWLKQLPAMDAYGALLFQIVGQQLSVASTRAIVGRMEALFGARLPEPEDIVAADPERLRSAGLSRRKVETLRALAEWRDRGLGRHQPAHEGAQVLLDRRRDQPRGPLLAG